MRHDVYVPTTPSSIDPGSGIVGRETPEGTLLDYEGNRCRAENLTTWADRIHSAAGRAETRYPTSARRGAAPGEVVHVGTYDTETGEVHLGTETTSTEEARKLVCAWLGKDPEDELNTTSVHLHSARRAVQRLLSGTPQEQVLGAWYASTLR